MSLHIPRHIQVSSLLTGLFSGCVLQPQRSISCFWNNSGSLSSQDLCTCYYLLSRIPLYLRNMVHYHTAFTSSVHKTFPESLVIKVQPFTLSQQLFSVFSTTLPSYNHFYSLYSMFSPMKTGYLFCSLLYSQHLK